MIHWSENKQIIYINIKVPKRRAAGCVLTLVTPGEESGVEGK